MTEINETTIKAITWQLENTRKVTRKFKPYEKERQLYDFDNLVWQYRYMLKRKLKTVLKNPNVVLVDYTALSTTTLKDKKNRYLLNQNGNYYIKGFVVALNVVSRTITIVETNKTQLTLRDVNILKAHLPKNSIIITDKRHNGITNSIKMITQLIEVYFGSIKKQIYQKIRQFQKYQNGYVITNMSIEQLELIYSEIWNRLNAEIVRKVKPKLEHKNLNRR